MDEALRDDYAACARLARHYENFPVVSRLVPASYRPHLSAIYAYARGADDLADEPEPRLGTVAVEATPEGRCRALEAWRAALAGTPPPGTAPIFRALAHTRRACAIPDRWLHDLLDAFCWDAEGRTYDTWEDLRSYADRSAAPIGRLVLAVAGVCGTHRRRADGTPTGPSETARVEAMSDDLCVALQYTNFWQDLSVDWPRRRDYVPNETWRAAGLTRAELRERFPSDAIDPKLLDASTQRGLQTVLDTAIARTEALYTSTRELPEIAGPDLAVYLETVWRGGREILARVAALGIDAFHTRPRLGAWDRLRLAVGAGWSQWSRA